MKKVILILYIIILSLVLKFTLAIGPRKYNYIFTKSSNLISENINNIYLGTILDKGNLEKTKNVEKFDYYLDDNSLLFTTKKHNDKIVGITIEQNVLNSTSKGIRIGSNIKDVIDMYGKNYYRRIEQGIDSKIYYIKLFKYRINKVFAGYAKSRIVYKLVDEHLQIVSIWFIEVDSAIILVIKNRNNFQVYQEASARNK